MKLNPEQQTQFFLFEDVLHFSTLKLEHKQGSYHLSWKSQHQKLQKKFMIEIFVYFQAKLDTFGDLYQLLIERIQHQVSSKSSVHLEYNDMVLDKIAGAIEQQIQEDPFKESENERIASRRLKYHALEERLLSRENLLLDFEVVGERFLVFKHDL